MEALGGTVAYDAADKKITLTDGDKKLEMWIGKTAIKLNGKSSTTSVPPMVINSRTMVPLRFAAETLGYTVEWKAADKKIVIQ
jgi:hypothetical protein